ncbi:acyltransferase family protein [Microbacterium sp. ZW T6_19]|uniref:acyltransferase family protein n=1 Tax=Microbacterium sp. ZW T6_19 TaxID=3378082 RepID=UPI0038549EB8
MSDVRGPLSIAQAFNPRSNSLDFLRWLMAFLVIFSHSGPVAGFYGGHDLGVQISDEQSLGGVAVAGFFFFSGFLITKSRMGRSTIWRYFWRRCLRIFPAFWAALVLTVVLLAPIAWHLEKGTFDGYWSAAVEAPTTYFIDNMFLTLGQRNIAGLGETVPYFLNHGARDWNGSAWTLSYEFLCYIVVGLLGLFGALASKRFATAFAVVVIALNALQWLGAGNIAGLNRVLADPFMLMFFAPFAFGMLFALHGDKIIIDDRIAIGMLGLGLFTYAFGGWNVIGQYGFLYFLMWVGVRLPLTRWARFGDFSYGIYIYAWPLMTLATYFGLQKYGWIVYHVVIVVAVHLLAIGSWHLIEKPAMSLKDWTPKPLTAFLRWMSPMTTRVKRRIVNPDFSSTRFAETLRTSEGSKS